jgi:cytolysin-activating lysine-acyltransferase
MTSQQTPARFMPVAGAVLMLARRCPPQARYPVAQLVDRVWPSLMQGRYVLYTEANGRPVGFCNWMLISQSVLDEYLETNRDIRPDDWDSGNILFFPEMMAPDGHALRIISDLRDNVVPDLLPGYGVRAAVPDKDGTFPTPRTFKWTRRPDGVKEPDQNVPKGDLNIRIL